MKLKTILKILSILLFSSFFFASSYSQTIELDKKFGSLRFYQDSVRLNIKKMMKIVKTNPDAAKIAKDAFALRSFGLAFRTTGIILFSISLRRYSQSRDDASGTLVWAGALIGISIPFTVFSTKKITKAVNIYNQGIFTGYNSPRPFQFSLVSHHGEIGIQLKF